MSWQREPLYRVVLGTGEPVLLFIHPNATDLSFWAMQQARFSTWFTTIAMDLPGYGRSPRIDAPTSLEEVATKLWEAARGTEDRPLVIAGTSIGVTLALHMHALRPDRSAALVLTGGSYRPGGPKAFAARRIAGYRQHGVPYRARHQRDCYTGEFADSDMGRYLMQTAAERDTWTDIPSILHLFEAHGRPDPEHIFDAAVPAVVISGAEDFALDGARALSERLPDGEMHVIENTGHGCSQEKPWEWDTIVLDFLRRRTAIPLETQTVG
jgi:3-oxoadipate enol-lactonase